MGDLGVLGRIPGPIVDAVEDTGEASPQSRQEPIQATAGFPRSDLARVGRADGIDPVGKDDPALDEGQLLVKFQAVEGPEDLRQPQPLEGGAVEQPLIGQIVDGEDGGGAIRLTVEQGGHQARLPVIAVNELRAPVQHLTAHADAGYDLAKEHEAIGVVTPVLAAGVGVGVALPGEVIRGIHQVGRQFTVRKAPAKDAHRPPGAGEAQVAQGPEFTQLLHGPGIGGDDETRVIAQFA